MNKFNYFLNGITTIKPYKAITMADVVKAIQCQKSKKLTEALRAIADQERAAVFKRTRFDYATFSGTFNTRKSSQLIDYSGYMVIDIDNADPLEVKQTLLNQNYFDIALMFTSPGGYGVKVVVTATTANEHKEVFRMYQRCFDKQLGVSVDNSGSDIARACFIAYDQHVYYNPHAKWRKLEEHWPQHSQHQQVKHYGQSATRMPVYSAQSNSGGYNGLSPLEDFNTRGDVEALLIAHHWTVNKGASNSLNTRFTRPGKRSGISADLRTSDKILYVFTNNTPFEAMRGYNPAQVFAVLECGGNFSVAYQRLLEMGYGQPLRSNWRSNNTFVS